MRKIVIWVGGVFGSLVLLGAVGYFVTFSGQKPGAGPSIPGDIKLVQEGFVTSYVIDDGSGGVALIDAGVDPQGKKIFETLAGMGKHPENVTSIFITHAHSDHIAAIPLFKQAKIYAMTDEVPFAEGKAAYTPPLALFHAMKNASPFHVDHPLRDGETIQLGKLPLLAFSVPGHTPGSAAFFFRGVLFTGDAATISSGGALGGPVWAFSMDRKQGLESLHALAAKIKVLPMTFGWIATAHHGTVTAGALFTF